MLKQVEINPEIARLAQHRSHATGVSFADELARNLAQEAIYNADVNNDLLIDEERAFSGNDALVAAFGVNDLVVNGCRLDVRAIDEEGRVSIARALVSSQYLSAGTLVMSLQGPLTGQVVAFIPAAQWQSVDSGAGDQQTVFVKVQSTCDFDLSGVLRGLPASGAKEPASVQAAIDAFELATFVANRQEVSLKRQKELVSVVLAQPQSWIQVDAIVRAWSGGAMRRLLNSAAQWNLRAERLTDKLAAKFKRIKREQLKEIVLRTGERLGGQPESATFRKALLSTLAQEELSRNLAGNALKKASNLVESVFSGRMVNDAIKDCVKNPVALELASQIKKQRNQLTDFMEATTQELSAAFQQMALQPVYATHSQDPQGALESVNEALYLLDAGELAQSLHELDAELSDI